MVVQTSMFLDYSLWNKIEKMACQKVLKISNLLKLARFVMRLISFRIVFINMPKQNANISNKIYTCTSLQLFLCSFKIHAGHYYATIYYQVIAFQGSDRTFRLCIHIWRTAYGTWNGLLSGTMRHEMAKWLKVILNLVTHSCFQLSDTKSEGIWRLFNQF